MPTTPPARRRARRHDPQRRERMIRAAVDILNRDGVLGLSHRAVALEADVPLGSTTYHFRDLEALLTAALAWLTDEEIRILEEWRASWDLANDLEDALVALALLYVNVRREESILEYEVHVLAYRRPSMQSLSVRWEQALRQILTQHVCSVEADLIIAMLDGVMLHGLGLDVPLSEAWAREAVRCVLRDDARGRPPSSAFGHSTSSNRLS